MVERALKAKRESRHVEFKQSFDQSAQDWCEIIKDIAALANSGGGAIVFGVDNHGQPTGRDASPLLNLDPADITNKLFKYTSIQFAEFEVFRHKKLHHTLALLTIRAVSIPLVFTAPGTYSTGDGKQKTAFGIGTVYFRHGAKSEPGNSDDIRQVIDRQIETLRKTWIKGVRKVVQAPLGSQIIALPREIVESTSENATPIRLVDDPSAPTYQKIDSDKTHPHRQKELIAAVNAKLGGSHSINQYDIQCLR
jgi:hypothetical protein